MNETAILDRLTEVFRETLDEPEIELKRETTAEDLEDWDSVSNIQLMVAVEQAFGLTLRTGEIAGLRNVGELMDVIAGRLAG
jgi:acyl carrier protein